MQRRGVEHAAAGRHTGRPPYQSSLAAEDAGLGHEERREESVRIGLASLTDFGHVNAMPT